MKYWALVVSAVVTSILLMLVNTSIGDAALANSVSRFVVVNAKLLSVFGAFIAFLCFAEGDYLRRAWGWLALGSFMLVEADLYTQWIGPLLSPTAAYVGRGAIVVIANVITPVALVLFARALKVAGLDLAGTRRGLYLATAAAAAIALVVAGEGTWASLRALTSGSTRHLSLVASGFGDIASFVLLAPLIYTVATLRGGTLGWPFLLLTASGFSWLVYDGAGAFTRWIGGGTYVVAVQESARLAACLFLFAAGLAQRWVVARASRSQPVVRTAVQAA